MTFWVNGNSHTGNYQLSITGGYDIPYSNREAHTEATQS
jgi:hypothetical protein